MPVTLDPDAAAVKEHQARREAGRQPRRFRGVDARRDRSVRGGDRKRLDRFQFGRLGIGDGAAGQIELAGLLRRQCFVWRAAGFLKGIEDGSGVGIEGHGHDEKNLLMFEPCHSGARVSADLEFRDDNLRIPGSMLRIAPE